MYVEHLTSCCQSPTSIGNYIAAVRHMHKRLHVAAPSLDSFELTTMLRAVRLTMLHHPNRRAPLSLAALRTLVDLCSTMGRTGVIMKVAITFAFFGLLRQSNLAPQSVALAKDPRNTRRNDVVVAPPGLIITLRWTKTLQTGENVVRIPLPRLTGSRLCPVDAFIDLSRRCPASPGAPLLCASIKGRRRVFTTHMLRSLLRAMLSTCHLSPRDHSLHGLRRGGASALFNAGVGATHIQHQGTWRSDAFWQYIAKDLTSSPVVSGFQQLVFSTK